MENRIKSDFDKIQDEIAQKYGWDNYDHWNRSLNLNISRHDFDLEVMEAYSKLQFDRWIDLNEQTPNVDTYVLIYSKSDIAFSPLRIVISKYTKYGFESGGYDITHWQSLPNPPKP